MNGTDETRRMWTAKRAISGGRVPIAVLASVLLLGACGGQESQTQAAPTNGDGKTVTLFADDFADNNSGWPTTDNLAEGDSFVPGLTVAMRNGQYAWDFQQEANELQVMGPEEIEDLQEGVLSQTRAEADVAFTTPGLAVLLCHSSLDDDTAYRFSVSGLGHASIVKYFGASSGEKKDPVRLAGTDPQAGTPTPGPPAFQFIEGQPVSIAFECQYGGNGSLDLRGFVNGQKLLEVNDPSPHPTGAILLGGGMSARSRDLSGGFRPFTIEWNTFRIGGL